MHQGRLDAPDKDVGYSFDRNQNPSQCFSSRQFPLTPFSMNLGTDIKDDEQGLFPSELVTGESNAEGKSTLDGVLEGVPIPKSMNRPGRDEEMAAAILCMSTVIFRCEK